MPAARSRLSPDIDLDGDGKQTGFLRLPHSVHRSAWLDPVPIAVIGRGAGPRVLLMAGNHGDELEGAGRARAVDPRVQRTRCVVMSSSCPRPISGGNGRESHLAHRRRAISTEASRRSRRWADRADRLLP